MFKVQFKCDTCGNEEYHIGAWLNWDPRDIGEVTDATPYIECKKCGHQEELNKDD